MIIGFCFNDFFYKNIYTLEHFTPLKNLIRSADDSSVVLPVTDLYGAPLRGADSNLHRYKWNNFM